MDLGVRIASYFWGTSGQPDAEGIAELTKSYLRDAFKNALNLKKIGKMEFLLQDEEYKELLRDFLALNTVSPPPSESANPPMRQVGMNDAYRREEPPSPPITPPRQSTPQNHTSSSGMPTSATIQSNVVVGPPSGRHDNRLLHRTIAQRPSSGTPLFDEEVSITSNHTGRARSRRSENPIPRTEQPPITPRRVRANDPIQPPTPVSAPRTRSSTTRARSRVQTTPVSTPTPVQWDVDSEDATAFAVQDPPPAYQSNAGTELSSLNNNNPGYFYVQLLPGDIPRNPRTELTKWWNSIRDELEQESTTAVRDLAQGLVAIQYGPQSRFAIVSTPDQDTAHAIVTFYRDKCIVTMDSTDDHPNTKPAVLLTLAGESVPILEVSGIHAQALPGLWAALKKDHRPLARTVLDKRPIKACKPNALSRAGNRNYRLFVLVREEGEALEAMQVSYSTATVGISYEWDMSSGDSTPSLKLYSVASPE